MHRAQVPAVALLASVLLASAPPIHAAPQAKESDLQGCADHPLLTRMDNMGIKTCRSVESDRFVFKTGKTTTNPVEGRLFEIRYEAYAGVTAPSPLAIIRNHQQAILKIGGKVQYEDSRYTVLSMEKDGKEVWTQVDTAWGRGHMLTIVEKQAMQQEVVPSAELFQAGLKTTGHVEVPGVIFDTGKSELKPESDAAVAEVAELLMADPALKVYVAGHTDNVGSLDLNT